MGSGGGAAAAAAAAPAYAGGGAGGTHFVPPAAVVAARLNAEDAAAAAALPKGPRVGRAAPRPKAATRQAEQLEEDIPGLGGESTDCCSRLCRFFGGNTQKTGAAGSTGGKFSRLRDERGKKATISSFA